MRICCGMILIDVNVLTYAFREDAPNHPAFHDWLEDQIYSTSTASLDYDGAFPSDGRLMTWSDESFSAEPSRARQG
jgi:hypothetical protein